jgi:nitrogen regulatory protein PII
MRKRIFMLSAFLLAGLVPNLIPKIRIDIAVNEDFVDRSIDALVEAARSHGKIEGEIGDGKFFITSLEQCVRIKTGERGGEAI